MMVVALEIPQRVPFGGRQLTKKELERVHLEKYRLDRLLATGDLPFDDVREGEAPDFVVSTSAGDEGIECVAFALEKRRQAYALFDGFKAQLLAGATESPLAHLADCQVRVWFGRGDDLPPKAKDAATIDRLVKTLREAPFDRTAAIALSNRAAQDGLPESLPLDEAGIFEAADAGGVSITPVPPGSLAGDFVQATGFDVQLSMSLSVTLSEVQGDVDRIVQGHDYPGVDRLVISVDAPDRAGFLYPAESAVLDNLRPSATSKKHIGTVTVHNFMTGAVYDLH